MLLKRYSDIGIISGIAHEIEQQTGSRRQTSGACSAVVAGRRCARGGCRKGWRTAPDGISLARGAQFARSGCAARYEQGWTSGAVGRGGVVARAVGIARMPTSARLWYAAVDDQACTP